MQKPSYMNRPRGVGMLFGSTIGKKVIMGITGAMMVGYLFMHMVGNTLLFAGEEKIAWAGLSAMDFYGWVLQEGSHGGIWLVRAIMLAAIGLHVWAALSLTAKNSAARTVGYQKPLQKFSSTIAGLTMRYGGVVIMLFLIFHLLHLTVGVLHGDFRHGEVFHNVVTGLSNPLFAGVYIVANLALGMHLYHGIASGLQTIGFNHPQYNAHRKTLSLVIALAIAGVNITFPLSVLLGVVG